MNANAQPFVPQSLTRRRNRRGRNRGGNNSQMMMLTGGTRDVKPQQLSFVAAQSGADATTTTTQAIPILRNFTSGPGRAQVIEILKVWFHWSAFAEVDSFQSCLLGTKNKGTTAGNFYDPDVFAGSTRTVRLTTSGQIILPQIDCMDLTDGDGNGFLVGTDNIYAQVQSGTTSLTNIVGLKILYRISGASIQEYVGIVQGQQ